MNANLRPPFLLLSAILPAAAPVARADEAPIPNVFSAAESLLLQTAAGLGISARPLSRVPPAPPAPAAHPEPMDAAGLLRRLDSVDYRARASAQAELAAAMEGCAGDEGAVAELLDRLESARRARPPSAETRRRLHDLYESLEMELRWRMARDLQGRTSPLVLSLLTRDPDPAVRRAVALHRRTIPADLVLLSRDEDVATRVFVAHHESTPAAQLAALLEDPDKEVSNAARENPSRR